MMTAVWLWFVAVVAEPLVDVQTVNPRWRIDMAYARDDNFTHQVLYPKARCLLRETVAKRLVKVQKHLDATHPGAVLLFKDCYRPKSVQLKMWDVVKNTPMAKYVANPYSVTGSVHNYGAAVDITLMSENGAEWDMGTPWDHLGPLAEPQLEPSFLEKKELSSKQVENRRVLRHAMVKVGGFYAIPHEWWHFDFLQGKRLREKYTILDLPL
jgi:D-alanyl-D-alanine dipeptidase